MQKYIYRETERQTDTEIQTDGWIDRHTKTHKDRQSLKQTDRQIDEQTKKNSQTDRNRFTVKQIVQSNKRIIYKLIIMTDRQTD